MYWLKPGNLWEREFVTSAQNGTAKTADSLPTATLARNGTVDTDVAVTVTLGSTGSYTASCTIPSDYAPGDRVTLRIAATVDAVPAKAILAEERLIAVDLATDIADQLYQDGGDNLINVNDDGTVNTNTVISSDDLGTLAGLINSRMGVTANQIAAAWVAMSSCNMTAGLIGPLLPGGSHRMVRGSAYLHADGRAPFVRLPKADYSSMEGVTAEFRLQIDSGDVVTATATITSLDENFWLVYADLTSIKTRELTPGTGVDQFWLLRSGEESGVSQQFLEVLEGLGVS